MLHNFLEEGRRKKEEERGKRQESLRARKKLKFPIRRKREEGRGRKGLRVKKKT
ncbi:MAG: hypothetical protein F6K17_16705 [Okeania sp. SIO3C4]|nr:hypothetical protein [Okeania sp. SIO3C4]